MAKTIQVTPEELDRAAKRIEELAGEYESEYTNFYTTTGSLRDSWQGKDNVAFLDQIDGFKDDFDKMHDLMLDYASFLRNSAKAYRETQDDVEKQARKLAN